MKLYKEKETEDDVYDENHNCKKCGHPFNSHIITPYDKTDFSKGGDMVCSVSNCSCYNVVDFNFNSELDKYKKEHGIYLEEKLGVKEWALKKEDALKLLVIIKSKEMICYGCDVVRKEGEDFVYDYGFFSYEQAKGQTYEQYAENSIVETEKYINNYPEKQGNYYYIVS